MSPQLFFFHQSFWNGPGVFVFDATPPPGCGSSGFSSLVSWVLPLSLEFSVRPVGQQRRSHLDVIKLQMPKKIIIIIVHSARHTRGISSILEASLFLLHFSTLTRFIVDSSLK